MIQAKNVCLSFGKQIVFDHISLIINQEDRIGLVGRNGSGKTTFLKAIMDPSVLDDGTVVIQKNKKVAYMAQEVVLESSLSVLQETMTTFAELYRLEQELRQLEEILPKGDAGVMEQYAQLHEQRRELNPQECESKTKKILMGLGFSLEAFDAPVSNLSVGWKMRIVLAKLLLQEADFYLFDEPTNHLDLMAKEWFLDFLKEADFGFIIICHERYFLDELCGKILELELGKGTVYTGNYTEHCVQKEHDLALLQAAYVQQQKEIERKQATIERFRATSRAKMAQSMERSLDKIDRIVLPPSLKKVRFNFPPVQQAGSVVMTVKNVSQTFGTKKIFEHVSFEIKRGQKVALIAPNGAGKTTLFNIIAGLLPRQTGSIEFGHNVSWSVFAQDQNKALNMKATILDNVKALCPQITEQKIRTFLGAFLFSGADILKKVSVLSGGEKNRVGMVSVLLQNANLLLLDEPTNHLDIPSKEILLGTLQEFTGTLLFVSHDRDFINALATDILELTPEGVHQYAGNYTEYLYQKRDLQQGRQPQAGNLKNVRTHFNEKENSEQSFAFEVSRKLQQLEKTIVKLESQIAAVNESFGDLEYGTPAFDTATKKLVQLQSELQKNEKEWEGLEHTRVKAE